MKRLLRVRTSLHTAQTGLWAFLACVAVVVLGVAVDNPDLTRMGAILALLDVGMIAYQNFRLGRVLLRVFGAVASRLELTPVGNGRGRKA